MAIPWLNGTTFELASTFVMKGVDKIPDQWFEGMPLVGKYYRHPDDRRTNTKQSPISDSDHNMSYSNSPHSPHTHRKRRSRHRRHSHADKMSPYQDDLFFSEKDADFHRRHAQGGSEDGRRRKPTRKAKSAVSEGDYSSDDLGGTTSPRAYNPAEYVDGGLPEHISPAQRFAQSTMPQIPSPNTAASPSGPLPGGYIPYSEIYSGRSSTNQPPMSASSHSVTSPQSPPYGHSPAAAFVSPVQSIHMQGQGQGQGPSYHVPGQGSSYTTSPAPIPYLQGHYSARGPNLDEIFGSSYDGSDDGPRETRRRGRKSHKSGRSDTLSSLDRRSRRDSRADTDAGTSTHSAPVGKSERKKAMALMGGTAIGGLMGTKMGGLPGGIMGLASGFGLAKSMTKANDGVPSLGAIARQIRS